MEKQPTVYIVQEVLRRNNDGEMVPIMDFTPAAAYGNLVVCLGSGRVALAAAPTVEKLREKLKDFTDDDFLLAAGDPSAIAIASAVASELNGGKFKLLKWDNQARSYIQVDINIRPRRTIE
jgi:hypothetical protein